MTPKLELPLMLMPPVLSLSASIVSLSHVHSSLGTTIVLPLRTLVTSCSDEHIVKRAVCTV